ncbi:AraC family transcriptional regulator [Nannocystis pusilla]|uniref:AraC family transcriptional regulator n=1 Tax=Nannocystis pusilla TaxID=889268 RepID=A0A9X3IY47_9BACT|nr:AraC family transcriptional regulator [Nannocystis pusilla]MCY1008126.1 AraC family transcriptional regulator [Nannocystis pusilla]
MDALTELRALVDRLARKGKPPSELPHLRWGRSTQTSRPNDATEESMTALIAVVLQGEKRSALGSHAFKCGAGDLLVASMKAPLPGQITRASAREPFLAVGLLLRPVLVASLLLKAPDVPLGATPLAVATGKASDELLDALRRYVRLVEEPADIPVLAEAIEREIVWRVMRGPHGAALRTIGLANSSLARISRAIDLLQARFAEPVRIAELARVAHMSEPTFNRHFRQATAMSPLQFHKLLRLQEARARLLAGGADVTSVGFAVGYQSLSQFSREYRRQFGVPPGEDAARVRGAARRR